MQERLHVAVLDEELPYPLTSGKRIRTFNLLCRLAERHRITYLCHRNADPDEAGQAAKTFRQAGIAPIVIDRPVARKSGLRFYARLAANLLSPLPYSVATHTSRQLREAAEQLRRSDAPNLWHCEWTPYAQTLRGFHSTLRTPHSALRTGATPPSPLIVMAHNVESLIWQRYAESEPNALRRWYVRRQLHKFERFEKWAYNAAARTIAVSPEDAALIRERFGAERVDVVDNGVDTSYFHPDPVSQHDPFNVLFLGSLDWRPNLDAVRLLLDDIFPKVVAREPRARLTIVGRNPPDWLYDRAALEENVEMHASVADVRPYLWRSAMLAVPLRIGGGSRLKILEALAAGVPVVSTRVGAEGLSLEAERHLVVTEAPAAMTDAILTAMAQPERMRQLAADGRRRVLKSYDWDTLADRLDIVWREVSEHSVMRAAA